MAGWQLSGYAHRGVSYASTMFEYIGIELWMGTTKIRAAVASLTYLGGTILPFPFIFWKMEYRWKGALAWSTLAIALVVAYQRLIGYTFLEKAFFFACFAGGMAAVAWIVARGFESWRRQGWAADDLFLCLWFVGMLIGYIVAFYSGSARYLLPACPAILLWWCGLLSEPRFSTPFF